ncbi:MAG: SDR family NAD(P)-dependent oxidoreductase [Clostridiales bacterium]|nr:SDR family NAD(P)-dependent oxidoreductase [Clostridiales bacterium]
MKKYALITGATGGLGKAFAIECAMRGYDLFLTDIPDSKLEELSNCLQSTYNIDVQYQPCDLMNQDERKSLFDTILQIEYPPQMTINVAGLDYEGGVDTISSNKIVSVMRINTEATLDITRFCSTLNHKQDYYIINVASMAGFFCMPLKAMYAASKCAIIQFSLAIREEIRSRGGHLLVLCPSGMRTNQEVTNSIDSQGFIGDISTLETGYIVNKTISKALSNKAKYVPGLFNVLIVGISKLVPDTVKARLIHRRWEQTRAKADSLST